MLPSLQVVLVSARLSPGPCCAWHPLARTPSFPGTLACSNAAEFQKRLLLSSTVKAALPAPATLSWMTDLLNIEWSAFLNFVSEGGQCGVPAPALRALRVLRVFSGGML